MSAVKLVENCVNKLEIKCPLLRDCQWKGKLSEAENHLKECARFRIGCKDCKEIVTRSDMKAHTQNDCPMRNIKCLFCIKVLHAKDLEMHHSECSLFPIKCPKECSKEFPRKRLSQHKTECPLIEVNCPYTKYGCKAKPMKRKDLLSHKKEFIIEHMDMVETKNQELEVEMNVLKSELKIMRRTDGQEWKLCDVDQMTDRRTVTSPDFCVKNYKLKCFCMFNTWFGGVLSFSIQRVKGDRDANLGVAAITECHIILQKSDGTQRSYDRSIGYPLQIGTVSEVFYNLNSLDYERFVTVDKSLKVVLYFDIKDL